MVSEAKEVKVEKKNKRFSLEERKALLKQYNELRKAAKGAVHHVAHLGA
jgi:hypothetical protein